MPVKKEMSMESSSAKSCCHESSCMKWAIGIAAIILGVVLWMNYLTLEQFFAIVFVLIGIKAMFMHHHWC